MIEAADMQELLARFGNEPTTADAVCATLRHCIVEGALRPGQRLLSDDLANRMGVSRTPVREALRKLEAEGYVSASGKGLVVREYSEKDLEEVFFIRELLEGAAARLAAENASSQELTHMAELLEDMEIASQRGHADVFRTLTGEFHSLIHRASRNDRLAAMLRDMQDNVRRFSSSTLYAAGRTEEALAEHRSLYEAFKTRDGAKAEDLARAHRRKTLAMRRQMIRSQARGEMSDDMPYAPPSKNPAWPA
jgi:DNA-binding GntR family transcriptional regulator